MTVKNSVIILLIIAIAGLLFLALILGVMHYKEKQLEDAQQKIESQRKRQLTDEEIKLETLRKMQSLLDSEKSASSSDKINIVNKDQAGEAQSIKDQSKAISDEIEKKMEALDAKPKIEEENEDKSVTEIKKEIEQEENVIRQSIYEKMKNL